MSDLKFRAYARDNRTGARRPVQVTVYREGIIIVRKARPRTPSRWKRTLRRLCPGWR